MTDLLHSIPQILLSLFGFILTIGFLVTIHEYGHFWVARKFGVKIEKFSIGFGKPIIKWHGKRDNTEYSIAWIPLGGYVKMYGENPNEATNDRVDLSHDISDMGTAATNTGSFSALPPSKRFLIAFAGPAVNLIFAVFALWILFISGIPAVNPYIGSIAQSSPIYQQLQSGDKITAVGGNSVATLSDATLRLVDHIGSQTTITAVDSDGISKTAHVSLKDLPSGSELNINEALGFNWEISEVGEKQPAIIDTVVANAPAASAGLLSNDKILRANDTTINNWIDFVEVVKVNANTPITLTVERAGTQKTLTITPAAHPKNAQWGYVGVSGQFNKALYDKYRTEKRYGMLSALPMAIKENYLQAKLLLKTLGRLIIGEASVKNMGGPLTIADYSGKSLQMGSTFFFHFLAAISLTLAVMNLLPIPVLDGGHMLLYTIEMVRGKALSEKSAALLMRLGLSVMLTFMLFVISIDVWKYLFGF